jgi:hypothetical protein
MEIDIRSAVPVECGRGALTLKPDGRVTMSDLGGIERTALVPDLALSNWVNLWRGDDHMYFIGEKGRELWFAMPAAGLLAKVMELDRLDLRDRYDPGGLHRIEFRELADGDLLIVHECGLARTGPDGSARWQAVHDDITARLERIADGVAWLLGESGPAGFTLDDGRAVGC